MSLKIKDIFCCPACRGPLQENENASGAACITCGTAYSCKEDILDLNPEPTSTASQEIEAHRTLESQWLDSMPEELRSYLTSGGGEKLQLSLPRLPRPDLAQVASLARLAENAEDFFECLDWMHIQPGEVILEIGAHTGWASHHLALRGAQVIVTDISPQLQLTELYLRHGIPMLRAYADMMVLPVREGLLDTIFSVATIHHAEDLPGLLKACARALKPNGRCVFFSEPVAGRYDKTITETFGAEEKALGIQEHIYTIDEYFDAARTAGMKPSVLPFKNVLLDQTRHYKWFRLLWLLLLRSGIGYHPIFIRYLYRYMLRFYPKIPFPHLALVFTKR
jgi:SAM-dependent methyltransferase/uncharacterized protein YbaR (Trm112 family)